MQKDIENGITVLRANKDMVLTNGVTFGTIVYLGKDDNDENWYEISAEEADEQMNKEVTEADYLNSLRRMGVVI
jgi:hypothetical protein